MKYSVVAAVLLITASAFAQAPQRPERRGGMRMGGMGGDMMVDPVVMAVLNPKVAEKLAITPEQNEKLKALGNGREANGAIFEKIRNGMKRQAELLEAGQVDEAAVMAVIDEVFEARRELAKAQTKRLIAIRGILTSEQISKAREEMKNFRGQRGRKPDQPAD